MEEHIYKGLPSETVRKVLETAHKLGKAFDPLGGGRFSINREDRDESEGYATAHGNVEVYKSSLQTYVLIQNRDPQKVNGLEQLALELGLPRPYRD